MTTRSDYTDKERLQIVRQIIKANAYNELRGNSFWIGFGERHILSRTWQSMKEHFRKKIIFVLDTLPIPLEEKKKIREGWENSEKSPKDAPRRKTFKNKFSDEESDISIVDSSNSSSDKPRKSKRKTANNKRKKETKEPEAVVIEESSSSVSPDLARLGKDDGASSSATPDFVNETDNETNEITVREQTSEEIARNLNKYFTVEDDLKLLQYMKNEIFLKRKEQEKIYAPFSDIYPNENITSAMLQKRFLYHILPNLHTYNLPVKDMIEIYETANLEVPEEWRSKLDLSLKNFPENRNSRSPSPDLTNHLKSKPPELSNDSQNNPNENSTLDLPNNLNENSPEISFDDDLKNCIYCHIKIKNESHILATVEDTEKEKTIDLLSKKFGLPKEFIHHTDFDSTILCEQLKIFRNCIVQQHEKLLTDIINAPIAISVREIARTLEICTQAFDIEDETPELVRNIKQERQIVETEHNYSADREIKIEVKEEYPELNGADESQASQCLNSTSSGSGIMRQAVENMVIDLNDPGVYLTPILNTQDLNR